MKIYPHSVFALLVTIASKFTDSFVFSLRTKATKSSLTNLRLSNTPKEIDSYDIDIQPEYPVEFDIPTLKNVKYRINQIIEPSKIAAIKLRHISVATQDLAQECKTLIISGASTFEKLAESLSMCTETKFKGGESSWLSMTPGKDKNGESTSLNFGPIPPELVNTAMYMNKGDIVVVRCLPADELDGSESSRPETWHVVQLIDVEMKLSISTIKRRRENFLSLKGVSATSPNAAKGGEMTYFMDTMGCQMNVADSERMEAQLTHLGFKPTNDSSIANIVVLNTCSVRDHAEQKVYSYIGPHALRKRKGEDVSIVVAGCVAQQEGEVLARRFPEVDIVMGPQYANRLGELIESVAGGGEQIVATEPIYQMEDTLKSQRSSDISAFVNVIYGCNERCTFCVVPTTRGVEQSRTKEAVVEEIRDLARQGFREVTLLGQNVDAWGRDMTPKQKFADLLVAVGEVEGIDRIRFLTSHPRYMSERVIQAVANNPRIMPCFNIPFQSGDNEVLKNMRRGYTRERYLDIVNTIRKYVPDAAITADVIVGFPGETEEQFLNTLKLMEEVQFEQVYFRAYSPRPNTPAGEWDSQLSEPVKQDRLRRVKRAENTHALNRSTRFVGRVESVLVEDVNIKNPTQVVGRNPQSRLVYFDGNIASLRGKIVKVEITEAGMHTLTGKLVGIEDKILQL